MLERGSDIALGLELDADRDIDNAQSRTRSKAVEQPGRKSGSTQAPEDPLPRSDTGTAVVPDGPTEKDTGDASAS